MYMYNRERMFTWGRIHQGCGSPCIHKYHIHVHVCVHACTVTHKCVYMYMPMHAHTYMYMYVGKTYGISLNLTSLVSFSAN